MAKTDSLTTAVIDLTAVFVALSGIAYIGTGLFMKDQPGRLAISGGLGVASLLGIASLGEARQAANR